MYARKQLRLAKSTKMEWRKPYAWRHLYVARVAKKRKTTLSRALLQTFFAGRVVAMTLPHEAESYELILKDFKQRASSFSEGDSCEAQVCGLLVGL